MFKLAWRNIMEHKLRMLLTTLGVILGVSLTLAVGILNQSMLKTFQDIFTYSGGKTDIIVNKNNSFSQRDIKYIREIEGVSTIAPMSYVWIKVNNTEGQKVDAGVKGIDINTDRSIRDYLFLDGEWFSGEEAREIVIDEKSAAKLGVKCDDTLRITIYGIDKMYRVVGVIKGTGAGTPAWQPEMFAPIKAITTDAGHRGIYERIDIMLNDQTLIVPIAENIKKHFGDVVDTQTLTDRLAMAKRAMGGMELGFAVVVAVVIFVGCFLIYNTFMVIVLERIQLIGLLKTLGMDKKQTVKMILVEGVILGVVGTVIGVGAGFLVGTGLMAITGKSIGVSFNQVVVKPYIFISAIAIGLIMPIVSCLIPARRASKYMPLEAMKLTDSAMSGQKKKQGLFKRNRFKFGLAFFIAAIFNFEVLSKVIKNSLVGNIAVPFAIILMFLGIIYMTPTMLEKMVDFVNAVFKKKTFLSVRNLMRNKNRTSITVSIIIVGVTMSIGFSGMFNSVKETTAAQIDKSLKADIIVNANYGSSIDNFEKKYDMIRRTEGVEDIYYERQEVYRDDEKEWFLTTGIKPDQHRRMGYFDLVEGNADEVYTRMEAREKVAVVGEYFLKNLGKRVGDTIELKGRDRKYQFTIVGIVNETNFAGRLAYINVDILNEMYGGKLGSVIGVKVAGGYDIDLLKDKIKNDIIKNDEISVNTAYEFRERMKADVMNGTQPFDIINVVTLLVALFGLMNTLLMSIFERKREIGMLRSIGSSGVQVRRMIFGESMAMGIYSAIIGLVSGAIFAKEANTAMGGMFDLNIDLYMPTTYVTVAVAAVLICAFVAAIYPSRLATSTGIVEAIKGE